MDMNIQKYMAFVKTVEYGSFTKAAEMLNYSQSCITTWDDYAIMSMVENGLGISILPELILQRIPYKIVAKELEFPCYRNICVAMREQKLLSLATIRFLEYLQYRKKE